MLVRRSCSVRGTTVTLIWWNKALCVCEAFVKSEGEVEGRPRAFVYISAEDIFRPFVPARYIESKREAELGLEGILAGNPGFRGVYIRPSAFFHFSCIFIHLLTRYVHIVVSIRSHIPPSLPPAHVAHRGPARSLCDCTCEGTSAVAHAIKYTPHTCPCISFAVKPNIGGAEPARLGCERTDDPADPRRPRRRGGMHRGGSRTGRRARSVWRARHARTHRMETEGGGGANSSARLGSVFTILMIMPLDGNASVNFGRCESQRRFCLLIAAEKTRTDAASCEPKSLSLRSAGDEFPSLWHHSTVTNLQTVRNALSPWMLVFRAISLRAIDA